MVMVWGRVHHHTFSQQNNYAVLAGQYQTKPNQTKPIGRGWNRQRMESMEEPLKISIYYMLCECCVCCEYLSVVCSHCVFSLCVLTLCLIVSYSLCLTVLCCAVSCHVASCRVMSSRDLCHYLPLTTLPYQLSYRGCVSLSFYLFH